MESIESRFWEIVSTQEGLTFAREYFGPTFDPSDASATEQSILVRAYEP